jgi:Excalibur calcium-binding domain
MINMNLGLIIASFLSICFATILCFAIVLAKPIKLHCKDFHSRKEAMAYFIKYKALYLDRDKNGIPCERLK